MAAAGQAIGEKIPGVCVTSGRLRLKKRMWMPLRIHKRPSPLTRTVPSMKSTTTALASLLLAFTTGHGIAQSIRNGDANNNLFQQAAGDLSVRDVSFNFLAGNDRLLLLRNDDLAGLNTGVANMGSGRDVVMTSFNMSGTFNLGSGDDFFFCGGDVSFNGNATDILVLGGAGNDLIVVTTDFCDYAGEAGNDVFVSDGSRNRFDGGDGNDTYSAEVADTAARIDLAEGLAFARFTTGEQLFSIENARGSSGDDVIFGDSNANRIDGLDGDDSIDGDPGDDTISGGAGTNELEGNTGTDTLVIQGTVLSKTRLTASIIRVTGANDGVPFTHTASGFEQVSVNNSLQSIAFFMGESSVNTPTPSFIAETPVEAAITGFGNGLTRNGNSSANTLEGATGHDDLAGLGGNDTLKGREGDDFLLGGSGEDRLLGGDGTDTLDGGTGADVLTGGLGNDRFLFTTSFSDGADTLTDFQAGSDSLEFKASLVGDLPSGPIESRRFKSLSSSNGAVDSDDRIIYIRSNGQLHFDKNGSASGGRVRIATLPANLDLTAADITIFR